MTGPHTTDSQRPTPVTTLGPLLQAMRQRLAAAPFEPSPREATLLAAFVLGLRETQILAYPERPVTRDQANRLEALLGRRLDGEPVAYLVGEREFYGRAFLVDPRVLIPRPDTEHLITAALALDLPSAPIIVDIGTGTGCLALTLALEQTEARIWAVDRSLDALVVARSNRTRLAGDSGPGADSLPARVALVQADMTSALDLSRVDLVVSNPPYIDPADRPRLSPEVTEFEPAMALFADDRGHALIDQLLDAGQRLRPGTPVLIEIGYGQDTWLRDAVAARPWLRLQHIVRDYGGIPRTAVINAAGT